MPKAFALVAVLALALLFLACGERDRLSLPTQPAPVSSPPTPTPTPNPAPAPAPREIVVGQVVDGDFANYDGPAECTTLQLPGECFVYVLTAPTAGTLTARVDYDAMYYDILLAVKMDNTTFKADAPWSPVVGRLAVTAGRTYQIAVGIVGNGNGYPIGKFTLSTALE